MSAEHVAVTTKPRSLEELLENLERRIAISVYVGSPELQQARKDARELGCLAPVAIPKKWILDLARAYAEQENSRLLAEVEQLRVQLAGCLVAAEGLADKGEAVKQGDYGWSLAFEKTRTLRKERDALLAMAQMTQVYLDAQEARRKVIEAHPKDIEQPAVLALIIKLRERVLNALALVKENEDA